MWPERKRSSQTFSKSFVVWIIAVHRFVFVSVKLRTRNWGQNLSRDLRDLMSNIVWRQNCWYLGLGRYCFINKETASAGVRESHGEPWRREVTDPAVPVWVCSSSACSVASLQTSSWTPLWTTKNEWDPLGMWAVSTISTIRTSTISLVECGQSTMLEAAGEVDVSDVLQVNYE